MAFQHKDITEIELNVGGNTYTLRAPNFGDTYNSKSGITINPIKDRLIIFRRATYGIQYDIMEFAFSAVKNYPSFISWLDSYLGEAMTLTITFEDNDGTITTDQYQGTIIGDVLVIDTDKLEPSGGLTGYCSADIRFTFEAA